MTPKIGYHLMDHVDVQPGPSTYTLRKIKGKEDTGEVSVSAKSIAYVGGVEGMARRIISVWLLMGDAYQNIGLHWYDIASAFAQDLATVYGLTLWQTSQVIAVLSPQNPWDGKLSKKGIKISDGNRICALNTIIAWTTGGEDAVMSIKGDKGNWGYAPDFLAKAVRILKGEELDWSGAPKTYRFAQLIFDPTRTDIVCCDSHASRIATGNLGGRYHVVSLPAYAPMEQAYLLAGSLLGVPAYVVQAGTWQFAVDGMLY
jgi:hypothetical protein